MERITVVKIGGNVIDSPEATARFVEAFAALEGPKMLIHGGGKLATRLAAQLGIESRMVDGRRITDRETLDVVTMVYAGLINKRLVAALSAAGCRAIGLSGADGDAVTSVRRAAGAVDYGYVGDIAEGGVNVELLRTLLDAGLTPVFSAITCDGRGTLLNTNADSVASAVAVAASRIAPTQLVFCFEKAGVLRDVEDERSVIAEITPDTYAALRAEGAISAGMLPKIDGALRAVASGVESVVIKQAEARQQGRCRAYGGQIPPGNHLFPDGTHEGRTLPQVRGARHAAWQEEHVVVAKREVIVRDGAVAYHRDLMARRDGTPVRDGDLVHRDA